jgi:hypothetical protein
VEKARDIRQKTRNKKTRNKKCGKVMRKAEELKNPI